MKKRIISIILLILVFSSSVMLSSCGEKETKYDIAKADILTYLWDNCIFENIDGVSVSNRLSTRGQYLYVDMDLPRDMTFEEVNVWLELIKEKIVENCSDKSFEPYGTIHTMTYYTIYIQFLNPCNQKPNLASKYPGTLRVQTEYFPITSEEDLEKALYIY